MSKLKHLLSNLHPHLQLSLYFLAITAISTLTSIGIFSLFLKPSTPQVLSATTQPTPAPSFIPTANPINDSQINILLLGHGDAGHPGGDLTDSITLAHFDTDQKILALISIPRDLWVTFPNNITGKINAAYSKDKDQATIAKQTISSLTNLPTNYYIAVNFFGLTAIVDELNGIDISLDQDLYDAYYPIRGHEQLPCDLTPKEIAQLTNTYSGFELEKHFTCRYETLDYPAGDHTINGQQALKIARSRHGSSDFARSQRQQAILLGIKQKLLSLQALQHAPAIYQQLSHTFKSDIDLELIPQLAASLIHIQDYQIISINLSPDNVLQNSRSPAGAYTLTPKNNLESIHQYIQDQLNHQSTN